MKGIHKRWFFGASRFLLGPQGSYKKDCQRVHEIVDKFIERAFANSHEKPGSGNDPTKRKIVLLDEMVKEYGRPSPEIRDQLLGIFFPARDTSAITLSNIFWFLARHRQVWQRLRNEVLAIDQPLTFEYLKSLKYLHSVISESTCGSFSNEVDFASSNPSVLLVRLTNLELCSRSSPPTRPPRPNRRRQSQQRYSSTRRRRS